MDDEAKYSVMGDERGPLGEREAWLDEDGDGGEDDMAFVRSGSEPIDV